MKKRDVDIVYENASIYEKLDGGNVQIDIGDNITFGYRSGKNKPGRDIYWAKDFEKFFWLNKDSFSGLKKGIYFGEFLASHRIENKEEYINNFFLIDIFVDGKFLDYKPARKRVKDVPIIKTLDTLYEGKINDIIIKKVLDMESPYTEDGRPEGIVIKNYDKQLFVKTYYPGNENPD